MSTISEIQKENKSQNIPWVEKYRPNNFDSIVLDPINREIFKNILNKNYFPNLLFYGPPGTGKTTTIINLINEYQEKNNQKNNGMLIHLNASDERGIDIIRNQIHQFVKSKNFFKTGLKFVILDEVDYMTKNAQQALKFLLQSSLYDVRFCLICNYISKIDESLKNEFICIRFNQLPKDEIFTFIKNISDNENLNLTENVIDTIQEIYNSDIRSMINFIQLNQNNVNNNLNIINNKIWEDLHEMLVVKLDNNANEHATHIIKYIQHVSIQYNMDKINILNFYFKFILKNKKELINKEFLNMIEIIMHLNKTNISHVLFYFITKMNEIFTTI